MTSPFSCLLVAITERSPSWEYGAKNTCRRNGPGSWTELVADYERFAKHYRNVDPATVEHQQVYLDRFYSHFRARSPSELLASLSPGSLQRFLFQYARNHGPGSRQWMQFSLRTFLRFCHHQRYLATDLSEAVPAIHRRRLSSVPKAIGEAVAPRLLETLDLSTPLGRRDHAIIQLLQTYGVRGIHVRRLTLQDVDWRNSRLAFAATKGGKPILQPLTPEVGNSLSQYLRHGRPRDTPYREIFLTHTPPPHPLDTSSVLSRIVARRLHQAGITLPEGVSSGSHSFRHRFAQTMLQHQVPLNAIADMLGHRDLNSTFLYTKVDVQTLHHAALDWPTEGTP